MNYNSILERNKQYSEKFVQPKDNIDIPKEIKKILKKEKVSSFLDMGCGDGILVCAIKKNFPKIRVCGIDISPRRINSLKTLFPKDNFYCKDVCNINLNKKFDFIHSSQVIEHVPSDKKMVKEIKKLLKKNGVLYLSSVIKNSFAIYKYRNKGRFVLDPTHEREYKDISSFLKLFEKDFNLIKYWTIPVKRKILGIQIRIPGYSLIYGIFKFKK